MSKQTSYNRDELLQAGNGTLWTKEHARLPLPNMLMMDRIPEISDDGGSFGKGHIVAELDINPELWFFQCHFNDDPVMPGCLGIDAMWQLTGFFMAWMGHVGHGRALGVEDLKFTGQILPTHKKVTYNIDIKRVINRKLVMAISNGTVSVDGKEIYVAKNMRVGIFKSTEGF